MGKKHLFYSFYTCLRIRISIRLKKKWWSRSIWSQCSGKWLCFAFKVDHRVPRACYNDSGFTGTRRAVLCPLLILILGCAEKQKIPTHSSVTSDLSGSGPHPPTKGGNGISPQGKCGETQALCRWWDCRNDRAFCGIRHCAWPFRSCICITYPHDSTYGLYCFSLYTQEQPGRGRVVSGSRPRDGKCQDLHPNPSVWIPTLAAWLRAPAPATALPLGIRILPWRERTGVDPANRMPG